MNEDTIRDEVNRLLEHLHHASRIAKVLGNSAWQARIKALHDHFRWKLDREGLAAAVATSPPTDAASAESVPTEAPTEAPAVEEPLPPAVEETAPAEPTLPEPEAAPAEPVPAEAAPSEKGEPETVAEMVAEATPPAGGKGNGGGR